MKLKTESFSDRIEAYRQFYLHRTDTFKLVFRLLEDRQNIKILETGCMRQEPNSCDGASSLTFAQFLWWKGGGSLEVIDFDPEALNICQSICIPRNGTSLTFTCNDSVAALKNKTNDAIANIDLFYFDSMDLTIEDKCQASMEHHLAEVLAVVERVKDDAIIMFDDHVYWAEGEFAKGKLAKQYLEARGWRLRNKYEDYQWILTKK